MVSLGWESESDDAFMIRYKDCLDTLTTHGGQHVLASPQIFGKDSATDDEVAGEVEKFKAVSFIQKLNKNVAIYQSRFLHEFLLF